MCRTTDVDELETRRRRAAYRATHRGTKEMDWLLGRYRRGAARGHGARPSSAHFERLLALPDPDLQRWIMSGEPVGEAESPR